MEYKSEGCVSSTTESNSSAVVEAQLRPDSVESLTTMIGKNFPDSVVEMGPEFNLKPSTSRSNGESSSGNTNSNESLNSSGEFFITGKQKPKTNRRVTKKPRKIKNGENLFDCKISDSNKESSYFSSKKDVKTSFLPDLSDNPVSKTDSNNEPDISDEDLPICFSQDLFNIDHLVTSNKCPLCLKSSDRIVPHVKKCAFKRKLTTKKLFKILKLQQKHDEEREAIGLPVVADKVAPKRKRKVKMPTTGLGSSLELALALSKSESEQKERDLMKEADNLIEAGLPDEAANTLRTLEKFGFSSSSAPGEPSGSKKLNKLQKSSLLLTRTPEEREKILTEKVAMVILDGEDSNDMEIDKNEFSDSSSPKSSKLRKLHDKELNEQDKDRRATLIEDTALREGLTISEDVLRSQIDILNSKNDKFFITFVNSWKKIFGTGYDSDITVLTEGRHEIKVHKLVLYVRCHNILKNVTVNTNTKISTQYVLKWDTISEKAASIFLKYLYCGEFKDIFNQNIKIIEDLMMLIKMYRVKELYEFITEAKLDEFVENFPNNSDVYQKSLFGVNEIFSKNSLNNNQKMLPVEENVQNISLQEDSFSEIRSSSLVEETIGESFLSKEDTLTSSDQHTEENLNSSEVGVTNDNNNNDKIIQNESGNISIDNEILSDLNENSGNNNITIPTKPSNLGNLNDVRPSKTSTRQLEDSICINNSVSTEIQSCNVNDDNLKQQQHFDFDDCSAGYDTDASTISGTSQEKVNLSQHFKYIKCSENLQIMEDNNSDDENSILTVSSTTSVTDKLPSKIRTSSKLHDRSFQSFNGLNHSYNSPFNLHGSSSKESKSLWKRTPNAILRKLYHEDSDIDQSSHPKYQDDSDIEEIITIPAKQSNSKLSSINNRSSMITKSRPSTSSGGDHFEVIIDSDSDDNDNDKMSNSKENPSCSKTVSSPDSSEKSIKFKSRMIQEFETEHNPQCSASDNSNDCLIISEIKSSPDELKMKTSSIIPKNNIKRKLFFEFDDENSISEKKYKTEHQNSSEIEFNPNSICIFKKTNDDSDASSTSLNKLCDYDFVTNMSSSKLDEPDCNINDFKEESHSDRYVNNPSFSPTADNLSVAQCEVPNSFAGLRNKILKNSVINPRLFNKCYPYNFKPPVFNRFSRKDERPQEEYNCTGINENTKLMNSSIGNYNSSQHGETEEEIIRASVSLRNSPASSISQKQNENNILSTNWPEYLDYIGVKSKNELPNLDLNVFNDLSSSALEYSEEKKRLEDSAGELNNFYNRMCSDIDKNMKNKSNVTPVIYGNDYNSSQNEKSLDKGFSIHNNNNNNTIVNNIAGTSNEAQNYDYYLSERMEKPSSPINYFLDNFSYEIGKAIGKSNFVLSKPKSANDDMDHQVPGPSGSNQKTLCPVSSKDENILQANQIPEQAVIGMAKRSISADNLFRDPVSPANSYVFHGTIFGSFEPTQYSYLPSPVVSPIHSPQPTPVVTKSPSHLSFSPEIFPLIPPRNLIFPKPPLIQLSKSAASSDNIPETDLEPPICIVTETNGVPPDFDTMDENEVLKRLEKYGIKKSLSKNNKAKKLLKFIYDELHPRLPEGILDDCDLLKKVAKSFCDISTNGTINAGHEQVLDGNIDNENDISNQLLETENDNEEPAVVSSSDSDEIEEVEENSSSDEMVLEDYDRGYLAEAVKYYVRSNRELYTNILLLKVVQLKDIVEGLRASGIKFRIKDLMDELDKEGVIYQGTSCYNLRKRKPHQVPGEKITGIKKQSTARLTRSKKSNNGIEEGEIILNNHGATGAIGKLRVRKKKAATATVTSSQVNGENNGEYHLLNGENGLGEPSVPKILPFRIQNGQIISSSCDAKKTLEKENTSLLTAASTAAENDKDWVCDICTLINKPTALKCGACENRKPGLEVDKFSYEELVELESQPAVLNREAFECKICFTDVEPGEGIVLRDCLHMFCRICLAQTIQNADDIVVKCPYIDDNYACTSKLQEREIKYIAPPEVVERHQVKVLAITENAITNAFHCKTPDCKNWCIVDNEAGEQNVNAFPCDVCGATNCIPCQAIHPNMNCQQYQSQLEIQAMTDPEAKKTYDYLKKMVASKKAMHCPKCFVILMKSEGCDWIKCSMCHTEICWATFGPRWGPKGFGDLSGGCRCNFKYGQPCAPHCQNCH